MPRRPQIPSMKRDGQPSPQPPIAHPSRREGSAFFLHHASYLGNKIEGPLLPDLGVLATCRMDTLALCLVVLKVGWYNQGPSRAGLQGEGGRSQSSRGRAARTWP